MQMLLCWQWPAEVGLLLRVQLNLIPGRKGLRNVLGDVPSWVAFQDKEKVEVRPFLRILILCRLDSR